MRIRFALLTTLYLAASAQALTVRALSLDELVARAARVVHARCVSVTPVSVGPGLPGVEITLAVAETLKGEASERLVVRQVAGQWRSVVPTCRAGDEVVLFLHAPSDAGLTSPVGLGQGYLQVVRSAGQPARLLGDPRIVSALSRGDAAAAVSASRPPSARAVSAPLDTALETLRVRCGVGR